MAASNPIPNEGANRAPRWQAFREQAVSQYLACLAAAGRVEELESEFRRMEQLGDGVVGRYHLAVALAIQERTDESLTHLRALMGARADQTAARKLAFRLLAYKARKMAQNQDWSGLSAAISEAVSICPPGVDPSADLAPFRQALPVGHLRAGDRAAAARMWEEELRNNPRDTRAVHNLALLHYWWARSAAEDSAEPFKLWRDAISYWALLANLDGFWSGWQEERKTTWGFDFPPEDLEAFRKAIVQEQLEHLFQMRADECTQKGDIGGAARYDSCLTATLVEKKSAAAWGKALTLLGSKAPGGLLALPAGYAFFDRMGLLKGIAASAAEVAKMSDGALCAAELTIYFSDTGIGAAAVLSEDRGRPDDAIHLLDSMSVRGSAEAAYVRGLALAHRAANHSAQGNLMSALADWNAAQAAANQAAGIFAFREIAGTLKASVSEALVKAVQREAARLKTSGSLDDAIQLLENTRSADASGAVLEYLCIYLCDRANARLIDKKIPAARTDVERVLSLKPGYERGKLLLSTVFNNEGCEIQDPNKSIPVFEKALELNPDNYMAKRNLSTDLKAKAVAIFNGLNQYTIKKGCEEPIRLLERAIKLIGTGLSDDALQTLEKAARISQQQATALVEKLDDKDNNDLVKPILRDLAVMYNVRFKQRGF